MPDPSKLIAGYPELKGMPQNQALEIIYGKTGSDVTPQQFEELTGYKPSISAGVKADVGYPVFKGMSEKKLSTFRAQYPEFKDQPNEQFVENVYQKYFKDKASKEDYYESIGYRTEPAEVARGLAAGAVGLPIDIANLINLGLAKIPGVKKGAEPLVGQIPQPQLGAGPYYQAGEQMGQLAPLLGGGAEFEAARLGLAGAEEAPEMVSSLAKYLGTRGGRALTVPAGFGAYGAVTQPEDRARGAISGAELGMEAELAAPILGGIAKGTKGALGKILAGISPTTQAQKILDSLGQTEDVPLHLKLQTNRQEAAKEIASEGRSIKKTKGKQFQDIINEVGGNKLYDTKMPADAYVLKPVPYTGELAETHASFSKNPTFENAHNLRSAIGREIAATKKDLATTSSPAARAYLTNLTKGQNSLKSDIDTFLNKTDTTGKLSTDYTKAIKDWKEEAVPYKEHPTIDQIVRGQITNPNLSSIFRNPGINRYGEGLEKITEDLGDPLRNRIIYSELGKREGNVTPERALRDYDKLGPKGLGDYVTPKLEDQFETLRKKTESKNWLTRVLAFLVGRAVVPAGAGGLARTAGGLFGLAYEPRVERQLSRAFGGGLGPKAMQRLPLDVVPGQGVTAPEQESLMNLYRLIAAGLTANLPNQKEEK